MANADKNMAGMIANQFVAKAYIDVTAIDAATPMRKLFLRLYLSWSHPAGVEKRAPARLEKLLTVPS